MGAFLPGVVGSCVMLVVLKKRRQLSSVDSGTMNGMPGVYVCVFKRFG